MIQKVLSFPLSAKLLLVPSIGALLFGFTMQYGFGYQPCILCLWQRVPFGVTIPLLIVALTEKPSGRRAFVWLALCAFAYLAGSGLAVFHTGVEQHWWNGTSGCAIHPLQGTSPEDLRNALLQTVAPRCDEVQWTIFGLSMANLNIAFSLCLSLFAAAAAVRQRRK